MKKAATLAAAAFLAACGSAEEASPGTGMPETISPSSIALNYGVSSGHTAEAPVSPANGCLKKSIDECLATIHREMAIDDRINPDQSPRIDVNGREIAGGARTIFGHIDGVAGLAMVKFSPSKAGTIDSIEAVIPDNPMSADTREEYDRTGIFEMFKILLGDDCPSLDRMSVYQFFQNKIKPRIVSEGKKVNWSDTGIIISYDQKAENIPFCGAKFSFRNTSGYDAGYRTRYNPHGAFSSSIIYFK